MASAPVDKPEAKMGLLSSRLTEGLDSSLAGLSTPSVTSIKVLPAEYFCR